MKKIVDTALLPILFVVLINTHVLALDIPLFNQRDYNQTLGTCNGCTIASDGCAVTSLVMVSKFLNIQNIKVPSDSSSTGTERIGLDPEILDDWLTWKDGYDYNATTCPGLCLMKWSILPMGLTASPRQYNSSTTGISPETYEYIDKALANRNPVIAGVHWSNQPEDSHFVVITSRIGNTYNINDPWDGEATTLDNGVLGRSTNSHYIIDHYRSFSGALVRIEGQSHIYWIQNRKAYRVLGLEFIDAMSGLVGWDRNKIHVYPANVLEIIPPGHLVPEGAFGQAQDFISTGPESNGLLIKKPDDPKIYRIGGGWRRLIPDQIFNDLGYNLDNVIVMSNDFFDPESSVFIAESNPIYSSRFYDVWLASENRVYDAYSFPYESGSVFYNGNPYWFMIGIANIWGESSHPVYLDSPVYSGLPLGPYELKYRPNFHSGPENSIGIFYDFYTLNWGGPFEPSGVAWEDRTYTFSVGTSTQDWHIPAASQNAFPIPQNVTISGCFYYPTVSWDPVAGADYYSVDIWPQTSSGFVDGSKLLFSSGFISKENTSYKSQYGGVFYNGEEYVVRVNAYQKHPYSDPLHQYYNPVYWIGNRSNYWTKYKADLSISSDCDGDHIEDVDEDKNLNGRVNPGETDPLNKDTDNDGLMDGPGSGEDTNANGIVDPGETDPNNPDTDGDGIFDGTEKGLTEPETGDTDISAGYFISDEDPTSTTDPTNPDSDGDGILDGEEDINKDGAYDPELGETSPITPTTTICSTLGNNHHKSINDLDIYNFIGEDGEEITISLKPDYDRDFEGERATLILKSHIRRVWLFEIDRSDLPNEITVTMPASGKYSILVIEQACRHNIDKFTGDYCLSLESSLDAWQTLEDTYWVE